jgi:hypothetical protein
MEDTANNIGFRKFLILRFMKEDININTNSVTAIMYFFQSMAETVSIAVVASYIYSFLIGRGPKIIFPNKLVIRYRTCTEDKETPLAMGIMIGNISGYNVYNVVGTIIFKYVKQQEPLITNNEYKIKDEKGTLEKYYRFSFPLEKFPMKFLQDIVNRPNYEDDETIVLSISGNLGITGNFFTISKTYHISDIIYDSSEFDGELKTPIRNIFTNKYLTRPIEHKIVKKVNWMKVFEVKECGEDDRVEMVEKIKNIIENKSNG